MITQEILNELMSFSPEPYLTTTLYLHIDGSPQNSHLIELKDILRKGLASLERHQMDPEIETSVRADFQKIKDFVALDFERSGVRTLVISSCSARKFWKVIALHVPFGSHLSVQSRPFIQPLSLLLDEFGRFLIVLVERARARIFEMYAGEIQEHSHILDPVPGKVRMGGYAGYEEKRISRHIEDHVRRHYRRVADVAFELYKRNHHASVIILGSEQNTSDFRHYLPAALQDRIAGIHPVDVNASLSTVLQHSMAVEKEMKAKQDMQLLERLFRESDSGGLAVLGLEPTLFALQQGQVNLFAIQTGYGEEGYKCPECESLSVNRGTCEYCQCENEQIPDIVEEAVRVALLQGSQVKHVTTPDDRFQAAGKVGAILRFRL